MRLVVSDSCAPASAVFCSRNLGLRMVPVSCSHCWGRLYCSLSSGQMVRRQLRAYDRIAKNKTTDTKATGQRAIALSCHIPLCVAAYAAVYARETLEAITLLNAILVLLRAKLTCGGNACNVSCYKNTSPETQQFHSLLNTQMTDCLRTQKNNLELGWPTPVWKWSVLTWELHSASSEANCFVLTTQHIWSCSMKSDSRPQYLQFLKWCCYLIHCCVCFVIVVHEYLVCPEQLNFLLFFGKIL